MINSLNFNSSNFNSAEILRNQTFSLILINIKNDLKT